MLTKSELTAFCKLFNKRRGTRCKAETGQMTDVLMQLRLFEDNSNSQITYDLLKDMLDYAPLEHIKKLTEFMSIRNVKMYLMDQQEQEEQLPEKKETLPNEEEHYQEMNEVVKSFGIIESTLANVLTEKYAPQMADEIKLKVDEYIKENYGPIQRKVIYEVPEHGQVEAVTHEMFETVLAFVLANEPVMLVGPAGTGKNVLCQQIAEAMDLPFYFSNAVTQEYKLTGFTDANGIYQESQFYKAFKNGGVFMLDEIDASTPEVLIILNAAIANRYFDFPAPIGKVEAHPDFRILAGANTYGTGSDYIYTGRQFLDGASLDRFALIEIGYSERIERSITKDEDLLDFYHQFRQSAERNGVNVITSYRSLKRLEKMKNALPKDQLIKYALTKNLEKDDIRMLKNDIYFANEWTDAFWKLAA